MAGQEDSPLAVDLDFAITEIRNLHADRTSSGSLCYLVYDFLRKRIEHDRPRSGDKLVLRVWPSVSAHDRVQGRQIRQARSILALGPHSHLVNQGPQLLF